MTERWSALSVFAVKGSEHAFVALSLAAKYSAMLTTAMALIAWSAQV